ncbi:MAG: PAS domain S-box protein, partial [candidate division Zixibacteria bacterium]|nr:PAS domain S-box protein [candidate division Zixibacteria bacterium]NIR67528.1 PAS domain S-box protein [candidate division Zixibacteria bacterium]NIS16480.1 PAS domain S-box protein [candidate division Zixibacteria bacterium]NIS44465.1 PAS domain S-box protein [candidate division Zixibacteria bacterium]NIT52191.1 PAS domain S-box protein [candidate division Zixibacteria bacterium]
GNIISWNRGAERMYGYSRDEALKMTIDRIVPEEKIVELNNLRVVLQSRGEIETLETKRRTKSGELIDIWLTISVYNTPLGRPAGFLTIERDITRQKKEYLERKRLLSELSRQRLLLEAILDQSPLGIIIAERSGKIILQNSMLDKIFKVKVPNAEGFSDYGKVRKIFHDDGALYKPEDFPLYRVLKEGETIIGEVAAFKAADGSAGTIEMHAAPVRNESGEIIAGVVIVQDITHDIEYENKLKETRDFAENIIASTRDGLLVLDGDLKIVRCNLPYSKMFDLPVKKILQKSIFEIQDGVWDDPRIRRAIDSLSD